MKKILLFVFLCSCGTPAEKIKLAVSNQYELSQKLKCIGIYNQYRFRAIFEADSLGVCAEEVLARKDDNEIDSVEIDFYTEFYNNSKK